MITTDRTMDRSMYFFQGQRLSATDLNEMINFTKKRDALLAHVLVGQKGIIEDFESAFTINVIDSENMSLQIQPGAAINSNGDLLWVKDPVVLSLREKATGNCELYYLQVTPKEVLENSTNETQNQEAATEFRYRRFGSEISLSRRLETAAVELGRIYLSADAKSLRLSGEELAATPNNLGVFDVSLAPRISIASRNTMNFRDQRYLTQVLRNFRELLRKIGSQFPKLEKLKEVSQVSIYIEAELSEGIFLKKKLHFLLTELEKSLGDCIEEIRITTQSSHPKLGSFWNDLLQTISHLTGPSNTASLQEFRQLEEVTVQMSERFLQSTTTEERKVMSQQSIEDVRHIDFAFHARHSFGGTVYSLKSAIIGEALQQSIEAQTHFDTQKAINAKYGNGKAFSGKGRFYSEGKLHLKNLPFSADRNSVLFFQVYKRRAAQDFSVVLNGQVLQQERLSPSEHIDEVINIGVLVNSSLLSVGENQLTIDIHRIDLDFGLLGIWLYQESESRTS